MIFFGDRLLYVISDVVICCASMFANCMVNVQSLFEDFIKSFLLATSVGKVTLNVTDLGFNFVCTRLCVAAFQCCDNFFHESLLRLLISHRQRLVVLYSSFFFT